MRERVKRIVAQILTFVMLMSVMPVEALAAGLNNSYSSDMVSAVSNGASVLSLEVYGNNATMVVGDSGILASGLDKNYSRVSYDSLNIVTVTLSGTDSKTARITANNPGTVTVTLSGSGVEDLEYTVTVKEQLDPFTVTITGPNSIEAYTSAQLSVEYTPETVTPSSVVWESSNEEILTVDQKGLVTTHSPGVATVTVHVTDAEGNHVSSEAYEITVTKVEDSTHSAKFVYLKTPTSDPASNNTSQWGSSIGTGDVNLDGATWSSVGWGIQNTQNIST